MVEVIVVLVILAILAAIGIPALTGYLEKAQASVCAINRAGVVRQYNYYRPLEQITNQAQARTVLEKVLTEENNVTISSSGLYLNLCPGGGECSASFDGSYRCTITCSIHGQQGTAASDQVLKEHWDQLKDLSSIELIKRYYALNGDTLPKVDSDQISAAFGEEPLYQNAADNLYWRPAKVTIAGKSTYFMFAGTGNVANQASWKGYLVILDGVTYRSTDLAWDGSNTGSSVAIGSANYASTQALADKLVQLGFRPVP